MPTVSDGADSMIFSNWLEALSVTVKILIDPKATMFLIGSVMDYRTDKLSSRFVFDNPNEKGTCGCGESFSVWLNQKAE